MTPLLPDLTEQQFEIVQFMGSGKFQTYHHAVDAAESLMATMEGASTGDPPAHTLTPGLYSRNLFMPAGSIVVSKIHKKKHQYVILRGRVSVLTEGGLEFLEAPYCGITEAGTRRVLLVHEDTEWITFHPTEETDMESIEADLILPRHMLGDKPLTLSEK